jgi:zinc protease
MYNMKKTILIISLVLISSILSLKLHSQTADLSKKLDTDPKVITGKLSNGLKYYIRENQKPENRVEMRLIVNAGSLQENEEQQGLAHFVEHMCFNGTKNFPKNELVNFLEKMGIRFGSGLNAYTSFGETVYKLQVPTDNQEILNTGYLVLEEWAHNVSFEEEEIEKERGVVIEEWRLGLNAGDRMRKEYFPVILSGSRYAERLPIGKIEVLENFKPKVLKDYYNDWYRPDLMAVIVVGDIKAKEAEAKIIEHFNGIKNPANSKKREEYSIPDNTEPIIAIATDVEASRNSVMIAYKHPHKTSKTIGDFREKIKHDLYNIMINSRLSEISYQKDAPFTYASAYYGGFLGRSTDAYMANATAKENKIDKCFESLLTENERVRKHGFTKTELARAKKELRRKFETELKEKDKTESGKYVREYINNYLSGDPMPGIENEMNYLNSMIGGIDVAEINKLAAQWISDNNMIVLITAPKKDGVYVPTREQIKQIVTTVKSKSINAYVDNVDNSPLMNLRPEGSKLLGTDAPSDFDLNELRFENGVKVILFPTRYKNDEILVSAYSPGGHSLSKLNKNYYSAIFADDIARVSGVGNYPKAMLDKKLQGKIVDVKPYISEIKEGFTAKCSPDDLETMLQLIYMYFTEPRKDREAFNVWKEKTSERNKNMTSNPTMYFYDTLYKVISNYNPRTFVIASPEILKKVKSEDAYSFYTNRFKDAGDFTFILVGNFDKGEIIPLLESYLGGLPASGRKESWGAVEQSFPDGITEVTVKKGLEDKSMVGIAMSNNFEWENRNIVSLDILMKILSNKLRESLREEIGGTYGVRAVARKEKYPEGKCNILITFGCKPDNVEDLVSTVLAEMEKLTEEGPAKEDFVKVKEILLRDKESDLKKNKFILKELESSYFNGEEAILSLGHYRSILDNITLDEIKNSAEQYFTLDNYAKVVLEPDNIARKMKMKRELEEKNE